MVVRTFRTCSIYYFRNHKKPIKCKNCPKSDLSVTLFIFPGTESILMSMKTHRDWAREVKGIDKPNIVVPNCGHPAFDKAAAYFKIHIIAVPVSYIL